MKRYNNNIDSYDRLKEYSVADAIDLLHGFDKPKFDESIDLSVNLGVDPKHADQIVRGTVALPNGTGKDVKVLVFAKDDQIPVMVPDNTTIGSEFVYNMIFTTSEALGSAWPSITPYVD